MIKHRRRALGVLALSGILLSAFGLVAHGDDTAGKPPQPVFPEDATVPLPPFPPGEEPIAVPEPFTVPARAGTCPNGGSLFDNPVLRYRICVPSGWGFTDFVHQGALDEIASETLENLHLIKPVSRAPGVAPFDDIARGRLVDIELDIAEPGISFGSSCEPTTRVLEDALMCEHLLNSLGLPAPIGTIRAITIVIPLASAPVRLHPLHDPAGSSLLVIVRAARADTKGVDRAWDVLESLSAY